MEDTILFNIDEIQGANVKKTLEDVCVNLEERGYDSIKQVTGYLISGDAGYISSYKDSRDKLTMLNRSEIIEFLLKKYIEK